MNKNKSINRIEIFKKTEIVVKMKNGVILNEV